MTGLPVLIEPEAIPANSAPPAASAHETLEPLPPEVNT